MGVVVVADVVAEEDVVAEGDVEEDVVAVVVEI